MLRKIKEKLQRNDIAISMYLSFVFILILTGVLTCIIFINLYQKNYIRSYSQLLTKQGKTIAKRVSTFEHNGKYRKFQQYSTYIDEIETAEQTDVWIISNKNAENPLDEKYTNAEAAEDILADEMYEVIEQAYAGKITENSSYDNVYGMMTLRVAVPVKSRDTSEVTGAVMMVSMIDRQTMGIDEGRYMVIISVLFSIIISFVVAMAVSRLLSEPLNKLGKIVLRLADGDYAPLNVKNPKSQIGHVESSLDVLAGRLEEARQDRENKEQARMDFFANISHELRTPITVVRGYAETLDDGVLTDEKAIKQIYGKILGECQGMERLVGDLFILSKMQNPDFEIECEPVSLVQIFDDVCRSADVIGRKRNIQIRHQFPEDNPCLVLGDYVRLRQMFMIIVDNAVKFSYDGGIIDISIEVQNQKFITTIRDYGVGISQEDKPYIFEKFYKSKLKQNEKGTGLGLMIAVKIIRRHGGTIRVESWKDKGSAFIFELDECTCPEEYI